MSVSQEINVVSVFITLKKIILVSVRSVLQVGMDMLLYGIDFSVSQLR